MRNQEVINKAEVTLGTLKTGGLMNPTQSSTFIRMVQNAPTLLQDARVIPMDGDAQKIEKIGFGQRILRPGVEGKAVPASDRVAPTTSTVELNAKEVIAEVNITYDTLENNIEGDALQNTIMQMLAERAAVDIEELILNGDTSSSDTYLAQLDGIRKQATSHIVDVAGEPLTRQVFKQGYKAVPPKYLRVPQEFRFYSSPGQEVEWKDKVADRQTNLGDAAVQGGLSSAFGVPVKGIANMQPYDADGTDVSDILLTHPKNIILGFSRNIRIEVDKDIRNRKFIIVLTAKLDSKFEEEDAVAKIIKVKE
ncbi:MULTISPECIES: phage major capsid protein [Bacillus]|uniref:phage major capsid protein n=1 Tax=Bacillus TaxID=1386 RepID=UPI00028C4C9E|nr:MULTISPECIES: phage major capsid protein [Bacillus]QAR54921.1 phage major capsid protein [Bacillus aerophilus]WOQ71415.1 phage major capsid protein [Bacillus stratosphericus]EKF33812.1 putative phage capsid protein [Bacillus xiamenensis]MBR0581299.1 phage major capsid protein [Bacillus altitudinis A23-8]QGX66460.1 phage major capsid protein [Bacillus sp. ms-22]